MRIITLLFVLLAFGAFAQSPEVAQTYNRGLVFYQSEDYGSAAVEFSKVLVLDSSFVAARQCLAVCYDEMGEKNRAAEQYRILIRQNPTDVRPYYNLAMIFEEQGRTSEALDLCNTILALRPGYEKATKLQQNILARTARKEPAQRIGNVVPGDPMLLAYNRALDAYKRGSYREAIKELESQPQAERDNNSYYLLGITHLKLRDSTRAAECFVKTLELTENYADAHLNLGLILYNRRQFEEAAAHFERATHIKPTEPYAGYFLGRAFYAMGRYGDALPYLQEAAMYIPDGGEARELFRKAYEKANRPAEQADAVAKATKEALGQDGLSKTLREKINQGVEFYNNKRYDFAADVFAAVVKEAPESALAHYYWGVSLRESGKAEKARAVFVRTLELDPSFAKAHTALGDHFYNQAEYHPASEEYQKAIDFGDESADTYFRLGNSFLKLRNEPKAIVNFRKAIQMDAFEAEYHFNLGLAHYRTKDYQEAVTAFNRAYELDNNNLDALYYGSLSLTGANRFEQALDMAEKALRKNREYAPGFLAAAFALENLGKETQAERYRQQAYELDPRLEPK
jgi:tetratricopeptide (TPR) repeat protein